MSDLPSLLKRVSQAGIEFVIVGGFAGVVHGCSYLTQDIDICCIFAPDSLLALQEALADLHPVHRMTPGRKPLELTAKSASQFSNLYLDTDLGRLDCLSAIEGLGDFAQVKQASELFEGEGMRLHVLTLDALIKTKQALNRPRDREALRQLQALRGLRHNGS
jgi:predicted nucleotidyltransferase